MYMSGQKIQGKITWSAVKNTFLIFVPLLPASLRGSKANEASKIKVFLKPFRKQVVKGCFLFSFAALHRREKFHQDGSFSSS